MSTSLTGFRGPTGNVRGQATGDIIPKGYNLGQLQQFTPEQMQLFQSLFSHVNPGSNLSRLAQGDEEIFDQIEGPALRQFGALQGNLANRFSGAGSMGSRRSSGFQNTSNTAASEFAQGLQSNRQGLQRQALLDLMGISESLLGQRPQERSFVEQPKRNRSFLEELLLGSIPALFQAGGQAGGAFLGRPA